MATWPTNWKTSRFCRPMLATAPGTSSGARLHLLVDPRASRRTRRRTGPHPRCPRQRSGRDPEPPPPARHRRANRGGCDAAENPTGPYPAGRWRSIVRPALWPPRRQGTPRPAIRASHGRRREAGPKGRPIPHSPVGGRLEAGSSGRRRLSPKAREERANSSSTPAGPRYRMDPWAKDEVIRSDPCERSQAGRP
jgi:hypothetical protein